MQVTVNDAKLYAEQHGNGSDLVMLHGVGISSARVWQFVLPSLAEHHRVLAYDLRGFDRSTNPSGVQTVSDHTGDLLAVFEKLGVAKAHVVGFSYSGLMAIKLALEKPQLVRSLILVGTSAGLPPHMRAFYQKRVDQIKAEGMTAYADYHSKEVFTPQFLRAHADRVDWYREQFVSTNRDQDAYTRALLSMMDVDFREKVTDFRCPVLLVCGAHDRSPMNSGSRHLGETIQLHRLIGTSELVIIPDAGHYVQIDQPETFVKTVREFTQRIE